MRRLIPALALLAAGCTSTSPGGPAPTTRAGAPSAEVYRSGAAVNIQPEVAEATREFPASPDAVWDALVQVYGNLEIEVAGADSNSRTLFNQDFVVSRRLGGEPLSRYLRCGMGISGANADQYRIHMNIVSRVTTPGEGTTRLETVIEATGANPRGSSNTRVACTSTHRLERRIAQAVADLVG